MDLLSVVRNDAAREAAAVTASAGLLPAFSLEGRTAVVTGAASGIGRATAEVYAAAGARVVLADRAVEHLEEAAAGVKGSLVAPVDVTKRGEIEDLARLALRETGAVDVWVNAAGIIRTSPITETTEEDLEAILAVNLKGVFWSLATAAKVMTVAGRGSIINVASAGGETPVPERAVYGMTKAGVIHLTKTAAAELGPKGIRVNAVAPGFVETGMTSRLWTGPDGSVDEERRTAVVASVAGGSPLGRIGQPDDIAYALLYLAADASKFMTGEVLRPNGGVYMA